MHGQISPPAPSQSREKPGGAPERSLVDLPPIVTNIASPNDLWIRVEASIVIEGKSATPPDILAAEIATDALAYLRTLTIGQIEGPIGLENIRQDLADRASVRSKGKVSELVLKTLVLQ
jgi:flagellar protein FliL